jgi:catechol 2,3-dioxygenase-like lactoylglutathione lyase family enzyme
MATKTLMPITTAPALGLNHMGLCVRDLDKSHAFYCGVVGMKEEVYHEVCNDNVDKLFNNSGVALRFWMLTLDGFRLQIVQYLNGGGAPLDLQHNRRGCPHLCIQVRDVRQKYEEIAARGDIRITSEIIRQVYDDVYGDTFYVEDPDGMPVEFFESGRL